MLEAAKARYVFPNLDQGSPASDYKEAIDRTTAYARHTPVPSAVV